jgi:glycerophosphoryl diester phosphodiesterase
MVEVDVRESRDGYIVVILDATVDRTTNGRRCVKDMSLRELRKR